MVGRLLQVSSLSLRMFRQKLGKAGEAELMEARLGLPKVEGR